MSTEALQALRDYIDNPELPDDEQRAEALRCLLIIRKALHNANPWPTGARSTMPTDTPESLRADLHTSDLLPMLSMASREGLDEAASDVPGCRDFSDLVLRCMQGDDDARAQGGLRGWRPSGPNTLALRIALELAFSTMDEA
jgi:hypothetical protein